MSHQLVEHLARGALLSAPQEHRTRIEKNEAHVEGPAGRAGDADCFARQRKSAIRKTVQPHYAARRHHRTYPRIEPEKLLAEVAGPRQAPLKMLPCLSMSAQEMLGAAEQEIGNGAPRRVAGLWRNRCVFLGDLQRLAELRLAYQEHVPARQQSQAPGNVAQVLRYFQSAAQCLLDAGVVAQ